MILTEKILNNLPVVIYPIDEVLYNFPATKKAPANAETLLLVEHLENSSPLIIEEIHRWRNLLWDDWLDYQHHQKQLLKIDTP